MKKLITLISLLSISNTQIQAITHTLLNNGKNTVAVQFDYHGFVKNVSCRPDTFKAVAPGETVKSEMWGCGCALAKISVLDTENNTFIEKKIHLANEGALRAVAAYAAAAATYAAAPLSAGTSLVGGSLAFSAIRNHEPPQEWVNLACTSSASEYYYDEKNQQGRLRAIKGIDVINRD